MILHEILKYPSVELVVGLELDQQVARSTFKHAGVQPHFDDDRVEWWFGDACKSILMLPSSYFGSFDVVIVDLVTEVADGLKVIDNVTLTSAAEWLLHKDGVIIRNEEHPGRQHNDLAEYMVELVDEHVPIFCQAGFSMGSNSRDLLTTPSHTLNVDTLALNTEDDLSSRWVHYRKNDGHIQKRCSEWTTALEKLSTHYGGILLMSDIEIQQDDLPISMDRIESEVGNVLADVGLIKISSFVWEGQTKADMATHLVVLLEGYLMIRIWPQHNYFGIDLQLWNKHEKRDLLHAALVSVFPEKVESTSTFRVVTGGMSGINDNEPPSIGLTIPRDGICNGVVDDVPLLEMGQESDWLDILPALFTGHRPQVAILCPQTPMACNAYDDLVRTSENAKIVRLSCNFTGFEDIEDEGGALAHMKACKIDIMEQLLVARNTSALIVDQDAPRYLGQAFLNVFKTARVRKSVLADRFVALAPIHSEEDSWRRALLDRFRRYVVFNPVYQADVHTSGHLNITSLALFSFGDTKFYAHLSEAIKTVETKNGVQLEVQSVRGGKSNFQAEFLPPVVASILDYDLTDAYNQLFSQQPLGDQSLIQYEVQESSQPIDGAVLRMAVESALTSSSLLGIKDMTSTNIGKGCVVLAAWSNGNVIVSYDGRSHIDMNVFTTSMSDPASRLDKELLKKIQGVERVGHDSYPRGVGRVVNCRKDREDFHNLEWIKMWESQKQSSSYANSNGNQL